MTTLLEPFSPLFEFSREFDRMFSRGELRSYVPAADLLVTDDDVKVFMDVPGLSVDDLEIELVDDALTIRGERAFPYTTGENGQHVWRRLERGFGKFERTVRLPPARAARALRGLARSRCLPADRTAPAARRREPARCRAVDLRMRSPRRGPPRPPRTPALRPAQFALPPVRFHRRYRLRGYAPRMLGDDLGELLGHRIPADHSRQVLADHYAGRVLRGRAAAEHPPRVMDLGCGAGDSVDLFRSIDPGVRWVGVDVEESPEVGARTRTDAEFVTFDGRRLPFDDASFELVYCKQVLEHVEHPRELVREAARVLAPGGHLAGSTSQLEAFHSRSTLNWTPYGFTKIAEDAGLEVIELRPVIDGFTLVAWRALGLPPYFHRWWARESPPYRLIELAARAARLDARTRNQIKLVLAGQFAFLARRS